MRSSIKRVLPVIKGLPGSYRVDGMKRLNINKMILDIVIDEHIEKFGKEPVFVDSHLDDPETLINLIMDAIAKNKPYNELEPYSEEEEDEK